MGSNYTLLLHPRSFEENIDVSIFQLLLGSSNLPFMSMMLLKTNSACPMKGRQSSEGTPVTLSPGARGKMVQVRWWQLLITPHYHSAAELSRSWPVLGGLSLQKLASTGWTVPAPPPVSNGIYTQLSTQPHSGQQLVTPHYQRLSARNNTF